MWIRRRSPDLSLKNLLSQFLRSFSLSKVMTSTGSGKDGNLTLQIPEGAKEPPVRVFGVRLWRLVQHKVWRCHEEFRFGHSVEQPLLRDVIEPFVDGGTPFEWFPEHHALPVPPNSNRGPLWMEVEPPTLFFTLYLRTGNVSHLQPLFGRKSSAARWWAKCREVILLISLSSWVYQSFNISPNEDDWESFHDCGLFFRPNWRFASWPFSFKSAFRNSSSNSEDLPRRQHSQLWKLWTKLWYLFFLYILCKHSGWFQQIFALDGRLKSKEKQVTKMSLLTCWISFKN